MKYSKIAILALQFAIWITSPAALAAPRFDTEVLKANLDATVDHVRAVRMSKQFGPHPLPIQRGSPSMEKSSANDKPNYFSSRLNSSPEKKKHGVSAITKANSKYSKVSIRFMKVTTGISLPSVFLIRQILNKSSPLAFVCLPTTTLNGLNAY